MTLKIGLENRLFLHEQPFFVYYVTSTFFHFSSRIVILYFVKPYPPYQNLGRGFHKQIANKSISRLVRYLLDYPRSQEIFTGVGHRAQEAESGSEDQWRLIPSQAAHKWRPDRVRNRQQNVRKSGQSTNTSRHSAQSKEDQVAVRTTNKMQRPSQN